jgi:fructooligosaccharide transport system permease protein
MKKVIKISDRLDRNAGIILSLPAVIILALFVIYPFLSCILDSLTNLSIRTMLNPSERMFIGLNNYASLFNESSFWLAFRNTFYFVCLVVPAQTLLALFFAVIINGSSMWQRILKFSFFLPVIVSMAVLSIIWALIYNPSAGPLNAVLNLIGISPQPFLNSSEQAMICIAVMSVWQGVGFQMMIYLAGLQTISGDLYEAAKVEGANAIKRFYTITLPLLKNITVFVITITTIFAFKLFVQPHLLTQGGPGGATKTLILRLYDEAFINGDYGKASAISIIFFIILIIVTLILKRLGPREIRS